MLNNPLDEINRRNENKMEDKKIGTGSLFTKSRLFFLISVFIVFSMPLLYRYLSNYF